MAELGEWALIAFYAWLALTIGSYAWIRLSLRRHSVPDGWRFNHRGARWFPGHLSFYGDADGVVIGSVTLFPLFWTVERGRSSFDLERLHLTTVFHVYRRAREVMSVPDGGSTGLICLFCGRDGFDTEGELDEHIDSHPYTVRRGEDGG